MKTLANVLVLGAATLASLIALADPAPVLSPNRDADGKPLPFGRPAYLAPATPLGSGRFRAIMAMDDSLPDHTLYYPADLKAAGRLPVIVWGNGACINAGNRFRIMLTELASHGFLVIAGGPIVNAKYEVGPQENPAVPAPGATPPAPPPAAAAPVAPAPGDAVGRNTAQQMIAGLDWAEKANADPASRFYRRLDLAKMAAAGQSCGGMLTTTVAGDARIKAVAIFSGAPRMNSASPGPAAAPGAPTAQQLVDAWHAPVLLLAGDAQNDIAHQSTLDVFAYVSKVPVFVAWQDRLTHIGTYGMANGGELARLGAQWFEWQLRGDRTAAKTFRGADCGLCREGDGWHVSKKRID